MSIDLTDPMFHDEGKARDWLEASRWPNGPVCPHCGSLNVTRMGGTRHRAGLFYCPDCRGQFTVMTGSVMERSHISLPKWVLAIRLMAASKKGVSAHQLHRMLDITYKTAWFMAHRIREAMSDTNPSPIGGEGKVVEVDELYTGKRETPAVRRKSMPPPTKGGRSGVGQKRPVIGLVERGGAARAYHVKQVTAKNVREVMVAKTDRKSRLHTDESHLYESIGREYAKHETVNHSVKEYARGDVTTNSVEGFFGIFERGLMGIYQHCGEQHLQRYLDEFSFRYSNRARLGVNDDARAVLTARGMDGKRLTYRRINEA